MVVLAHRWKMAGAVGAIGSVVLWIVPVHAEPFAELLHQPEGEPIVTAQRGTAQGDIVDVATASNSFQTLLSLLNELGMTEDLRGYGRFTVFAPTDAAFQAVPAPILARLQADRELMARVLAYHVVASGATPLSARDLRSQNTLTTLERSEVQVRRRRGTLYINEARVIEPDIAASNGVIHAIDQVLIPPDVLRELQ
jgi:uncharacterized surface protein with fasciclin (FAS1) repeats